MKSLHLATIAALVPLLSASCDRQSPEMNAKVAELQNKAREAVERQLELERQLEEQQFAAERDSIERERMQIEEARADLERQQGAAAEAESEEIRLREQELANREGRLEEIRAAAEEKEIELQQQKQQLAELDQQLSERDRELAGREALAIDATESEAETEPVADYGMFHDSLSSYGSWFETPDYGYVWQPVIVRDSSWRPYTRGRWACTDHGWTWISDEPFGWATYHYGRWALLRGTGWIWVPGSEWAPSWVSWRSSPQHIGWAPLPPETLAYRGHRWDSTVDTHFGIGSLWFNFVETRHFGLPIHRHTLPFARNHIYFDQSINITNIHVRNHRVICGGPSYGDVSRQVERPIPFYRLDRDPYGRPGRDSLAMRPRIEEGRLRVAAPRVDAAWNEGLKPGRVKGRIDTVNVERREELRPEVSRKFRESREENRTRAQQAISQLGGHEKFQQARQKQLEANRRQAAETTRHVLGTRPKPSQSGGPDQTAATTGPRGQETKPAIPPTSTPPVTRPGNTVERPVNPARPGVDPPRLGAPPKTIPPNYRPPADAKPATPTRPDVNPPRLGAPPKTIPPNYRPPADAKPATPARPGVNPPRLDAPTKTIPPNYRPPADAKPATPTRPDVNPPRLGAPPKTIPPNYRPPADTKPATPARPGVNPPRLDAPTKTIPPNYRPPADAKPVPPAQPGGTIPPRVAPPATRPAVPSRPSETSPRVNAPPRSVPHPLRPPPSNSPTSPAARNPSSPPPIPARPQQPPTQQPGFQRPQQTRPQQPQSGRGNRMP